MSVGTVKLVTEVNNRKRIASDVPKPQNRKNIKTQSSPPEKLIVFSGFLEIRYLIISHVFETKNEERKGIKKQNGNETGYEQPQVVCH